ncbi:MAG: hypothetical protein LBQ50_06855 [Planctomycetaceae bacterium]|nr:hypothetical protein [Planctomycetaceae bacterium]
MDNFVGWYSDNLVKFSDSFCLSDPVDVEMIDRDSSLPKRSGLFFVLFPAKDFTAFVTILHFGQITLFAIRFLSFYPSQFFNKPDYGYYND